MPRSPRSAAALLALALTLALLAAPLLSSAGMAADEEPAVPTIYKWVDENGIAHYTTDRERIPAGLRDRFDVREAAPAPRAPAARPTPPVPPAPRATPPTPSTPSAAAPPRSAPPAPEPTRATGEAARPTAPTPPPAREPARTAAPAPAPGRGVVERDFGSERDFVAVSAGRDLDQRIRDLEAAVQADEEALKALLAGPSGSTPLAVADDVDLRAIAERLPQRLAELDTLRAQRGDRGSP